MGSLSVLCTPCPAFAVSLVTTVLNRARWNPPVLSAWISLMAKMLNWFLYLRVICNSFGNCLIYLPAYRPSFWGGSLFCNALCILDLNSSWLKSWQSRFPHSAGCLSTLAIVSFAAQKLFQFHVILLINLLPFPGQLGYYSETLGLCLHLEGFFLHFPLVVLTF